MGLNQQLGVDKRAFRPKRDFFQDRPAKQLKRKVHVPNAQAEQNANQPVIHPRHHLALRPFGPSLPVADHHVGVLRQWERRQRIVHLDRQVAVNVQNPVFRCRRKPRSQ